MLAANAWPSRRRYLRLIGVPPKGAGTLPPGRVYGRRPGGVPDLASSVLFLDDSWLFLSFSLPSRKRIAAGRWSQSSIEGR